MGVLPTLSAHVDDGTAHASVFKDIMSRLESLERHAGYGDVLPGSVIATIGATADSGYALLNGQTLTGAQTAYVGLWNRAPAGWKSGANLVLPDMRGRTIIMAGTGSGLTPRTLATAVGVESVALTPAQTAVKGHSHTLGVGTNSGFQSSDHSHNGGAGAGLTGYISNDHTHNTNVSDVIRNANTIGAFVQDKATAGYNYGPANIGTSGVSANHYHAIGNVTANHQHDLAHSHTLNDGANGTAHDNMQPSYVLNWQVKL